MILNGFQPSYGYNFGFPTANVPSYSPAPVYQQPSIQSWQFDWAQSQQNLYQGWASFGGGGFSASASASLGFHGAFPSFGGGGGFGANAFASLSVGTNSTDLSSVFGSLDALPTFGLAGNGGGGFGGGSAFGSDPFSAGLQNIERQMFALAGNFGASGGGGIMNPFNNPFSARLQQVQQQLVQLAFTPQPTPFFQPQQRFF